MLKNMMCITYTPNVSSEYVIAVDAGCKKKIADVINIDQNNIAVISAAFDHISDEITLNVLTKDMTDISVPKDMSQDILQELYDEIKNGDIDEMTASLNAVNDFGTDDEWHRYLIDMNDRMNVLRIKAILSSALIGDDATMSELTNLLGTSYRRENIETAVTELAQEIKSKRKVV